LLFVLGAIYALAPTDAWMRSAASASAPIQPASYSETGDIAAARADAGLQDPFFTLAMREPRPGTFAGDLADLAAHLCARHCPQDGVETPSLQAVPHIPDPAAVMALAQLAQASR